VLNFVVTSNRIHLLVEDHGNRETNKSIQLLATRTTKEFNNRKNCVGAFWQDRYHATAIESDQHLARCLRYTNRYGSNMYLRNSRLGTRVHVFTPRIISFAYVNRLAFTINF